MKRTGEIVLSVIGAILNGLAALMVIFVAAVLKNQDFVNQFQKEINNEPALQQADVQKALDTFQALGWGLAVILAIGMVLGIVAAVKLRGNKGPKLAGILLIIGALLMFFFSIGIGWLPALLYLIAGTMSLVRKVPKAID
ncbi:membrane protein [Weizmannia acidilactici]|uniref:Membrane protein n=1 Tax=Weizmannia acidilactici TaxID=2607726 RepID=A0A5J4JKB9_9BACI|nr:DUF4064 domain-containing protein [Weizmannia acidilactici]GER66765.1 membrane protein [Weizmannia acidilactici]GER71060.1 membrane protein [Weizmannia acidilactici]GER74307.1 membrane protein [Weizmannia acidilactici]